MIDQRTDSFGPRGQWLSEISHRSSLGPAGRGRMERLATAMARVLGRTELPERSELPEFPELSRTWSCHAPGVVTHPELSTYPESSRGFPSIQAGFQGKPALVILQ